MCILNGLPYSEGAIVVDNDQRKRCVPVKLEWGPASDKMSDT